MKYRIENTNEYKKIVTSLCSIPTLRKQLNGIEQCIEIKTNLEEAVVEVSAVDESSHAISLKIPAEVIEEGRQIVLSSILKTMTSKLNPKNGLTVTNDKNLINYESKPYGTINDAQYFNQDSQLSDSLFDLESYTLVAEDINNLFNLIPLACSNTYNEKEIYLTTEDQNIKAYVQFSETSYLRYTADTDTLITGIDFKCNIPPGLLKIVQILEKDISLYYSKTHNSVLFESTKGTVAIKVDTKANKLALMMDKLIDTTVADSSVEVDHETVTEAINWQEYNATDKGVVDLAEEELDGAQKLSIKVSEVNNPSLFVATFTGDFEGVRLPLTQLVKGLKAMGNPGSKIIPIDVIQFDIKTIPVKNGTDVKCVHIKPETRDDVTSDVIMYEAKC